MLQVQVLPQTFPRCVLRLGPSILILKATSDLDGGTYNDKSETLALGLSPILLPGPYVPQRMLPKESLWASVSTSVKWVWESFLPCLLCAQDKAF